MNRPKVKGTAWESAIVALLRENGVPHAERRPLSGANDRGDIAGIPGVVIEAKAHKAYDIGVWMFELAAEMNNDASSIGFVWAKRVRKASPADGYIVTTPAVILQLLREAGYLAQSSVEG